jgi:hypothetical protein
MHVKTGFRCVGHRYINGIEHGNIRRPIFPLILNSSSPLLLITTGSYLTMGFESIAKSLDSSLGPKGKMLKEEFLVMVPPS